MKRLVATNCGITRISCHRGREENKATITLALLPNQSGLDGDMLLLAGPFQRLHDTSRSVGVQLPEVVHILIPHLVAAMMQIF